MSSEVDSLIDAVSGSFRWEVEDYRSSRRFESPKFKIAEHEWQLSLLPEEYGAVGFSLQHLSATAVQVSYKVTLRSHSMYADEDGLDLVWADPDGKVTFMPRGHEDSSWGCEELVTLAELANEETDLLGLADGAPMLMVVLDMQVFGCSVGGNLMDTELLELIAEDSLDVGRLMQYASGDVDRLVRAVVDNTGGGGAGGDRDREGGASGTSSSGVATGVAAGVVRHKQDRLVSQRLGATATAAAAAYAAFR